MAHTDFIPDSDSGAAAWMGAFARGIALDPARYNLLPADAAAISAAVAAYLEARAVSSDPATRTPVSVNLKDSARQFAEQLCRGYARAIKANGAIAASDKLAIGVRPLNRARTRAAVPATSPLLNILAAAPGVQRLRCADSAAPTRRAKPPGAMSLQLFVAIGDVAARDPWSADFRALCTTSRVAVSFTAAQDGKIATYFARWATRTGEVGPWSLPVSMRIAA